MQTLHTSPGLEDIWQLHWAYNGGIEHNPSGLFIANIDDPETIADVMMRRRARDADGSGSSGAPATGAAVAAPSQAPLPGQPAGRHLRAAGRAVRVADAGATRVRRI